MSALTQSIWGGDGFKLLVNEGDHVKAGQKLIEFDPEKIKAAGHPVYDNADRDRRGKRC